MTIRLLIFFVSLFLSSTFIYAAPPSTQCSQIIVSILPANGIVQVKPEDISILRITTYNAENFFTDVSRFSRSKNKAEGGPGLKPAWKTDYIADIISDEIKSDIAGLQEIDTEFALDTFAKEKMDNIYEGIVIKGNDTRGIQVGSLVHRRLPVHVEVRSFAHLLIKDALTLENTAEKLFSRDAPVSIFRTGPEKVPFLIMINMHSKSKRDRVGDPQSNILRTMQHQAVANIIINLQKEFGKKAPIIVLGDTNTNVPFAPELKPIKDLGFKDALELLNVPSKERVTHSFFPDGLRVEYSQIDAIFLSPSLQKHLRGARVHRYHNADGKILPLPKNDKQRDSQPSDHFPVFADIDFSSFVK